MTVGKRISSLRKERGLSQKQLATYASVAQSTISDVEKDDRDISVKTLQKICSVLDISLSDFFDSIAKGSTSDNLPAYVMDFARYCKDFTYDEISSLKNVSSFFPTKQIYHSLASPDLPVAGSAAAGPPIFDPSDNEQYVKVPQKYIDNTRYFVIRAQGDSMVPQIHNNDYVVVQIDSNPMPGDIVLIDYDDGIQDDSYSIKQLYKVNSNEMVFRSLNTKYSDWHCPIKKIRSLQKIVYIILGEI